MGWDKGGRYYTRSRREGGRIVREYVGGGPAGELAAWLDAAERDRRAAGAAAVRAEQDCARGLDDPVNELNELADLVVEAAMLAAGYRRHHRGEWRKIRERREAGG